MIRPIQHYFVGLNPIHIPEGNPQYKILVIQRGNMSIYRRSGNVGSDRDLAFYNTDKGGLDLPDSYDVVGYGMVVIEEPRQIVIAGDESM